ncbi:hypothetical protein AAMO2058_000864000 [Amorphochlora amoebiformis]
MEKRGNLSREIIAKDTVPLMLQALDPKNYTNPSIRELPRDSWVQITCVCPMTRVCSDDTCLLR